MFALIAGAVGASGGRLHRSATSSVAAGALWLQQLLPVPPASLASADQRRPASLLLLLTGTVRELRTGAAVRRRQLLLQQRKQQAALANAAVDDALLPKVALVGRPNVGKSALFNRLIRRRQALVYDTPASHVTRDYQEGRAQLGDLVFRVADTSGLEPRTAAAAGTIQGRATSITAKLLSQSHLALMVVDAKTGVLPADEELAEWLRRHVPAGRVMVVANKAEGGRAQEEMPQTVYDCYRLGFGEPMAVSASTGEGLADLFAALQPPLDAVSAQLRAADEAAKQRAEERRDREREARRREREVEVEVEEGRRGRRRPRLFPVAGAGGGAGGEEGLAAAQASDSDDEEEEDEEDAKPAGGLGVMKLAIMGLPNAGKSTLLNALLGEQRAVTGPEPGLTRDSVRAAWTYGDTAVELVDTAGWVGLGRTTSYDDVGGEVAAMSRRAALTSLAQVHVVLLVLDAERALASDRVMSRREVSLAGTVLREGKALVVVANKADVLSVAQRRAFTKALQRHLGERFLDAGELPVVEVSARAGTGLDDVMPTALAAYTAWNKRVSTARLNRFMQKLQLRMVGTGLDRTLERVKYLTQLKARPPTFTAFMAGSTPVGREFGVFLAAQLREVLGFQGVPLRVWFRYKEKRADRLKRLRSAAVERRQQARDQAALGLTAAGYEDEVGEESEAEEEEAGSGQARAAARSGRTGAGAGGVSSSGSGSSGAGSIMELARQRAAELRRDVGINAGFESEDEQELAQSAKRRNAGSSSGSGGSSSGSWLAGAGRGVASGGAGIEEGGRGAGRGRKRTAHWAEEEEASAGDDGYGVWVTAEEAGQGQAAAQADRGARSAGGRADVQADAAAPMGGPERGSGGGVGGDAGPGRPGGGSRLQVDVRSQQQQPRVQLLDDAEKEEDVYVMDRQAAPRARPQGEAAAAGAAAAVTAGAWPRKRQVASSASSTTFEPAPGGRGSSSNKINSNHAGSSTGSSTSRRAALRTAAALLLTARKPSAALTPVRPRSRAAGGKAKAKAAGAGGGAGGWGGSGPRGGAAGGRTQR